MTTLEIVERMRSRLPFDESTTASLGVGLKADPMFASIRPALSEFIGGLKKRPGELAELPTS